MSTELSRNAPSRTRTHRLTRTRQSEAKSPSPALPAIFGIVLSLLAVGFVVVGAGNSDLARADARTGLAARGGFGPLGQVCGNWVPDLWPGRVLPSQIIHLFAERGTAAPESVLWPAALAALAIGWIIARRLAGTIGVRSGLWFGLCWFGSLGVIDHSGGTGLDFLSGVAIVAAIDRLLARGSDWFAGLWTALAFLTGGWPPVALVLLAVIVIGRHEARFSPRLLTPPIAAFIGWSIWTVGTTSSELWAAAVTLPFVQKPDWWLALGVLGMGLPFSPLALLAVSQRMREAWTGRGRQMAAGWFQTALALAIAGTVIPGLSQHARVPALAGILVIAAMSAEAAWSRALSRPARRVLLTINFGLMLVWLIILGYGSYLWLLVFSYYRVIGILALILGIPYLALAWHSMTRSDSRRAVLALVLLAVGIKLVHWGYYIPEWNYRRGQGPWGRAIGQWLSPEATLYTFIDWPEDLTFAIGRPIQRLVSPRHLAYEITQGLAAHVLLLESEFEHWPEEAPQLTKLATLLDPSGEPRILARTPGTLFTTSRKVDSLETTP